MLLYDIVVIGGGPAGAMAAIGAKQQEPSCSVAVIDRNPNRIRHKIGEALLTGTIMTMTRAGLDEELHKQGFHRKDGAAYLWGHNKNAPWYVNYPTDDAGRRGYSSLFMDEHSRWTIHVPRHKFDNFLLKEAEKKRVSCIDSVVDEIVMDSDEAVAYALLDSGEKVFAKRWIDTTGQTALIAKAIGKREKIRSPRAVRYGYSGSVCWKIAEEHGFSKHRTNIVATKNGWIWVIHIGNASVNNVNDITSIGFVMHPKDAKKMSINSVHKWFPELESLFGIKDSHRWLDFTGDSEVEDWYTCPHFSYVSKKMHGSNWALAGDAAGFIDPILSQGVTLATHYGYERGIAAAFALQGKDINPEITEQYYTEIALLNEVCEMWYDNSCSSHDWKLSVQMIGDKFFNVFIDNPEVAFRLFTNLEHVRSDLSSFSACQMKEMKKNLKGANIQDGI